MILFQLQPGPNFIKITKITKPEPTASINTDLKPLQSPGPEKKEYDFIVPVHQEEQTFSALEMFV
jgi:hypothetical protein